MYRCRKVGTPFKYPEGIELLVKNACIHHLHNNLHHPESHKIPNDMSILDVVEMVCDWTAMSQEYDKTSCIEYVDNNIDKKWNFTEETKQLIYKTITVLDERLASLDEVSTISFAFSQI